MERLWRGGRGFQMSGLFWSRKRLRNLWDAEFKLRP
jgi:hypothetical protein